MAIQLCDQEGCKEPATHSYVWEWGQSGTVCGKHLMILTQTGANLGRSIQFAPISADATPPLQREERVKLRAEALVLKEELEEAKQRGLDLYRQNTELTRQVQTLTVRQREAEAQIQDAVRARDDLDMRFGLLQAENANLADELGRLRALVELPGTGEATSPGVGVIE